MHHHLEIVMPPTDDIESAVRAILEPFNEQPSDPDESGKYGFWDWYVIGGRWAGTKLLATYDSEQLEKFHAVLTEKHVTVSSFQAGKQEIRPATQIPMVDALWNEFFPEANGASCPLFAHSNDQYKSDSLLPDDVLRFEDVPDSLTASTVIFAKQSEDDSFVATEMFMDSIYNGQTFQNTTWDGTFADAKSKFADKSKGYKDEYREKITPTGNWLVVTVDYHS